MKKSLLLIPAAALVFGLGSCKKEEAGSGDIQSVSSVYKAVVFEYSATWCGPCGQYGYPAMHDLMAEYKYKTVGVFMHPTDDIVSQEPAGQEDIVDFFGFSGTPASAVNTGEDTYPTYLEPKVTQAIAANPTAKAGIGISKSISGNVVTVNTKTVFFEDVAGTYNLAIYITEDKIMEQQNGQTDPEVEHNDILRAVADGKAFGTLCATSPTKGTKVDGTYTITVPQSRNKDNLHVVAVLYKMENNQPTAVLNANKF